MRCSKNSQTPQNLWERACPRRGQHSHHPWRLTHRHRWQASSHSDLRCSQDLQTPQNLCPFGDICWLISVSRQSAGALKSMPCTSRPGRYP
ncbi:hypothetical protein EMIT0P12_30197 [Pseudomonas sp. IT-P12]